MLAHQKARFPESHAPFDSKGEAEGAVTFASKATSIYLTKVAGVNKVVSPRSYSWLNAMSIPPRWMIPTRKPI